LQKQSDTAAAVQTLKNFQLNGKINVFFSSNPADPPVVLPASQIIDKILSGKDLANAGLGNPAKDSTTPDIIVTLKQGFIWVGGNPAKKAPFKRAEHGGFSEADTHVALIVSGGSLDQGLQGTAVNTPVTTKQIAVAALEALGLDPSKLQGANIEGTVALPGLGLPVGVNHTLLNGQTGDSIIVATFVDPDPSPIESFKAVINWGDGHSSAGEVVAGANHLFYVIGDHDYASTGKFTGTVTVTEANEFTATAAFQVDILADPSDAQGDDSWSSFFSGHRHA
jgi:hypothetical protein